MRRTLVSACAAVTLTALLALTPSAALAIHAGNGLFQTYEVLAKRNLSPAPLAFTKGTRVLRPVTALQTSSTLHRRAYAVRLVHYTPNGPDAIIALDGGDYRSLRAALHDYRDYRRRSTRIRGHRGYLLVRRTDRHLVWSEDGRVYDLGSGTPRKVSLADLRHAAAGLQHLGGYYIGDNVRENPDNSSEAYAVTTERTISIHVDFGANCTSPMYPGSPQFRDDQTEVAFLRPSGSDFSFDVGHGWTGAVSGRIAPSAIDLDVRATRTFTSGDFATYSCDTGPLHLRIRRDDG